MIGGGANRASVSLFSSNTSVIFITHKCICVWIYVHEEYVRLCLFLLMSIFMAVRSVQYAQNGLILFDVSRIWSIYTYTLNII